MKLADRKIGTPLWFTWNLCSLIPVLDSGAMLLQGNFFPTTAVNEDPLERENWKLHASIFYLCLLSVLLWGFCLFFVFL